jgi:hypothetical protein
MSEIETEIIAGGGIFTPTESAKLTCPRFLGPL